MNTPHIDWEIIYKSLTEELSDTEQQQLEEWLSSSPACRKFYEQAATGGPTNPETGLTAPELTCRKKILFDRLFRAEKIRRRYLRLLAAAAVLALLIGSAVFFRTTDRADGIPSRTLSARLPALLPGNEKAILTLETGEKIDLDSLTDKVLYREGAKIQKDRHALIYTADGKKTMHYNKLYIPRGGEYHLVLADGTKVWVNSCSELIFPVSFPGNERVVELRGEAYFEVEKEDGRPFKVLTDGIEVKVYGTKFNVNSYEKNRIQTTLLEGRIGIARAGEEDEQILKPHEQAVYDKEREVFRVREVNANDYIAWKNGEFVFTDETIETIMQRLSIWYDVDVAYENEAVRLKRFTGVVERYVTIDKILYYIGETATVSFLTDGKKIFVK